MRYSTLTAKLSLAVLLAACAAKPIPVAEVSAPVAAAAPADLTSSIRGTREKGLLGSTGCFVAGIDGKMIPQAPRVFETPIPIGAGVHSILMGSSSSQYGTLPARLDAKSGIHYVIGCARDTNIPLYPNKVYVWIENEITHEVVVPKLQIDGSDVKAQTYSEPQETVEILATIRSANPEVGKVASNAYVHAIDGFYVLRSPENPSRSYKIKSGRHAILLGAFATNAFTEYPVLLDVEEGHTYIVGYVLDSGVVPGITNQRFTVWIDDNTTGARVVPAQRVKLKNVPNFDATIPLVVLH